MRSRTLIHGASLSVILFSAITLCAPASGQSLGLQAAPDGTIQRDGVTYRGIGVNYFDAFYRTMLNGSDTSYVNGFQQLSQHHIPFARFSATAYWPSQLALYQTDKTEYFRRMDGVVHAAEQSGVGLIPSMFWSYFAVPDLVHESINQWGNANSQTRQFMRNYVTDVVTRYKDSPAIWGWEFGNEYNLNASLPNGALFRPPVVPELGTPSSRTAADQPSYDDIRSAFSDFSTLVHQLDPHNRIIESGDSIIRAEAWHNYHENNFNTDTAAQQLEMLRDDNPAQMNVISAHLYGSDIPRLGDLVSLAHQLGKPVYIGEFGVPKGAPDEQNQYNALLQSIVDNGVSLASMWVYDYNDPSDQYVATFTNSQSYQLTAIESANAALAPEPSGAILLPLAGWLLRRRRTRH